MKKIFANLLIKRKLVAIAGAVLALAGGFQNSLELSIFGFLAISIAIVLIENKGKNFLNPAVGFVLFFCVYSIWYPLYRLFSESNSDSFVAQSIGYSFLGLIAFYVGYLVVLSGIKKVPAQEHVLISSRSDAKLRNSEKIVLALALAATSASWVQAMGSGYESKQEVLGADTLVQSIAVYATWLATGVLLLYYRRLISLGLKYNATIILLTLFFCVGPLITGERDGLFRLVICFSFIYFDKYKSASFWKLLLCVIAAAIVLPFSQDLKGLLLTGDFSLRSLDIDGFFISEFLAPSRNLYMLLSNGFESSWSFLFSDIARALVPFAGAQGFQSSGAWYNNVYREAKGFEGTSGWGFSLVAAGVLIQEGIGVVILFFFAGFVITKLYFRRTRSEYWYVFYLLTLSTLIYCIRADLANFLSQAIKLGGGSILFLFFARKLNLRRGRHANEEFIGEKS
jgi:oligosaccharide repeat unit polymerase